MPITKAARNAGGSSASSTKYGPTPGKAAAPNLNTGTQTNPVIIEASAPLRVMPRQYSDNIIVGQNVAAMPDHPKMTNQNTVRPSTSSPTVTANVNATKPRPRVAYRLVDTRSSSGRSGLRTFWY